MLKKQMLRKRFFSHHSTLQYQDLYYALVTLTKVMVGKFTLMTDFQNYSIWQQTEMTPSNASFEESIVFFLNHEQCCNAGLIH